MKARPTEANFIAAKLFADILLTIRKNLFLRYTSDY